MVALLRPFLWQSVSAAHCDGRQIARWLPEERPTDGESQAVKRCRRLEYAALSIARTLTVIYIVVGVWVCVVVLPSRLSARSGEPSPSSTNRRHLPNRKASLKRHILKVRQTLLTGHPFDFALLFFFFENRMSNARKRLMMGARRISPAR